jgi:hypothetical protein
MSSCEAFRGRRGLEALATLTDVHFYGQAANGQIEGLIDIYHHLSHLSVFRDFSFCFFIFVFVV